MTAPSLALPPHPPLPPRLPTLLQFTLETRVVRLPRAYMQQGAPANAAAFAGTGVRTAALPLSPEPGEPLLAAAAAAAGQVDFRPEGGDVFADARDASIAESAAIARKVAGKAL